MVIGMWNWIGRIADIVGIIGFPLAIWQIWELGKRVEASEKSIQSVLKLREHEKINLLLNEVSKMYEKVEMIRLHLSDTANEDLIKNVEDIVSSINHCIVDLPTGCNGIAKNLKSASEYASQYIQNGNKDVANLKSGGLLKDTSSSLYVAMMEMKKAENKYIKDEVKLAANQNS